MKIKIENCSSPGTSFTTNTNHVILLIYDWLNENKNKVLKFRDFRMQIQKDKNINDNNNRNIYPLLKNYGFINYSRLINTDNFFTNTGLAYVKTLQMIKLIEKSNYTVQVKDKAKNDAQEVGAEILYDGLQLLLSKDVSYRDVLFDFIQYLTIFNKINKKEFACLLYARQNYKTDIIKNLQSVINEYRSNNLDIEVDVTVRNDSDIREKTNETKRDEGLEYLTSYNYFTGLLKQAGLIKKEKDYFILILSKKEKLNNLLGVRNE